MKLELKHLLPYLLHRLKLGKNESYTMGFETMSNYWVIGVAEAPGCPDFPPCLRPLSDLTKEIEHNGEKFVPIEVLIPNYTLEYQETFIHAWKSDIENNYISWKNIQLLFEWHFDVFGLIDEGLAIKK